MPLLQYRAVDVLAILIVYHSAHVEIIGGFLAIDEREAESQLAVFLYSIGEQLFAMRQSEGRYRGLQPSLGEGVGFRSGLVQRLPGLQIESSCIFVSPELREVEAVRQSVDVALQAVDVFQASHMNSYFQGGGHRIYNLVIHVIGGFHRVLLVAIAVIGEEDLLFHHLLGNRDGVERYAYWLWVAHIAGERIPVFGLIGGERTGDGSELEIVALIAESHGAELIDTLIEDDHLVGAWLQVDIGALHIVGEEGSRGAAFYRIEVERHSRWHSSEPAHPVDIDADAG